MFSPRLYLENVQNGVQVMLQFNVNFNNAQYLKYGLE
jgi:hypothetical protein